MIDFCKVGEDTDGKYISIYNEDGNIIYTIFKGKTPFRDNLIFGDMTDGLKHFEVLQMAEIIENFDHFYNLLNQ